MQAVAYDFPITPLESAEHLAIPDREFRDLSKSVSAIEATLDVWKWLAGILSTLVVAAALGALAWCWHLGNKVTAMEQQLADGGNTKLVAELKAPKSPQQLQANLNTVTAQIQQARVDGKPPDAKKIGALSSALIQVVKRDPELPEAWQAAVQLVDYKFQPHIETAALPNCLDQKTPIQNDVIRDKNGNVIHLPTSRTGARPETSLMMASSWTRLIILENCVLDLADKGDFYSTEVGKVIQMDKTSLRPSYRYLLEVKNAHITYSGGRILPVNAIRFEKCSFDIKTPAQVPDKIGQSVTTQLLAAKESDGEIRFSTGA